jgi:2-dehydro-3-deoxyphosphogluconate aldolase/(4S)-4-hydroxy-2-oxoglutarate aldolase
MSSSVATLEILKTQRILPLFYHADATVCSGVVKALYDGGVRMVEFTNRGDQALARFTELQAMCEQSLPGMHLAVGTISTKADAENFIKAGAKVLISPFWDDDVFAVAKSAEVLWIPGCMTPTEIHRAVDAGLNIIKLFPGNVMGTGFVEAVRPIFPGIHFVVTGGVDAIAASVNTWMKSGVVAAGLGSKLITSDIMNNHQFDELQQKVVTLLSEFQSH